MLFNKYLHPQNVCNCQQSLIDGPSDTHLEVLQKEWIQKFAAKQVNCDIADLPELEQVANKEIWVS